MEAVKLPFERRAYQVAEDEFDTHEMSFDEKLLAVWGALDSLAKSRVEQAQEIESLRLRVRQLEAIVERLPTQSLGE